jgi:ParB family transcriptional regulator, chromosome partitioning protein
MAKVTGLGRGLGSLIPKKVSKAAISDDNRDFLMASEQNRILQIPVEQIEANPMQPRQVFDHEDLEELIESIKVHGIIQPLIVTKARDGYELIAGERRLRSAKVLGLATVPGIIREAGEQEKLELALIENVQRKNLNPIEKAVAYERLINEFNLTQDEAAEKLGVNRSVLANTVRFLELPEVIQRALGNGEITEGHAKIIAGLQDETEQLSLFKKIMQNNFTVRDTETERQKGTVRRANPRKTTKEPVIEEKEDMLRSSLNTKVDINEKGGQGQINIEFYSDEELSSIVDQIVN